MQYRAVGFDWGGVISTKEARAGNFTQRLAEAAGVPLERWRTIYFQNNHLINTGKLQTYKEFDLIMLGLLGKSENYEKVAKVRAEFENTWFKTNPEMVKLVSELKASGLKVGLLSNATKEGGQRIREIGAYKWFDVMMISAEIGLQKPQPEIFRRFAQALEVSMEELIYIDDAEPSLVTAEELGYRPILFRGYEDLVKKLMELEVLEKNPKTG